MRKFFRFVVRMTSFWTKEIVEILRQPRLVLLLVLGPFLILFLFGIGYRSEPRDFRTLFVAQQGSRLSQQIEEYATTVSPQLIYVGTISDENEALRALRANQIDLAIVAPSNAYERIRNSQQAIFTMYHNEIDPTQADYIKFFGGVIIEAVNRRVLQSVASEGQQDASGVQNNVRDARQSATALRQALEQRDALAARDSQRRLNRDLDAISLALGGSLGVLSGVQQTLGPGNSRNDAADTLAALGQIRQDSNALGDVGGQNDQISDADVQRATKLEQDLAALETRLAEFRSIQPDVLVSPFGSETKSIAPLQPSLVAFFVPTVLALLLQHLAVTLSALSIVRERQIGAMELFRVAPISSGETLIGKYLSYMFFQALLTAVLTALVIFGLRVPMLGNWLSYALVILALTFTSLGMGFIISLLVETDTQAVQTTMIVLLASVFFTGFFLSLESLWQPIHVISWSLPTTYGIVLLRNLMLRGELNQPLLLVVLTVFGLALALIAWLLMRRRMAQG